VQVTWGTWTYWQSWHEDTATKRETMADGVAEASGGIPEIPPVLEIGERRRGKIADAWLVITNPKAGSNWLILFRLGEIVKSFSSQSKRKVCLTRHRHVAQSSATGMAVDSSHRHNIFNTMSSLSKTATTFCGCWSVPWGTGRECGIEGGTATASSASRDTSATTASTIYWRSSKECTDSGVQFYATRTSSETTCSTPAGAIPNGTSIEFQL